MNDTNIISDHQCAKCASLEKEVKTLNRIIELHRETIKGYQQFIQSAIESGFSYSGHHVPTGENWHILGINVEKNQVCVAGWPATIAKLTDIRNLEKSRPLTDDEMDHRVKRFGTDWI